MLNSNKQFRSKIMFSSKIHFFDQQLHIFNFITKRIMLLAYTSLKGCGTKIVKTWVDDKKDGFEEIFKNDGELILRDSVQEGMRVELSLCDE